MRPLIPTALLGLAIISCDATGPASNYAAVGIEPVFTRAAAATYPELVDAGLVLDNIRMTLDRANGVSAIDTTVRLTASLDSVVLEMVVTVVTPPEERLTAAIELRVGDLVLFSGSRDVVAIVGSTQTLEPIAIDYVGPILTPISQGVGLHAAPHPVIARTAQDRLRE